MSEHAVRQVIRDALTDLAEKLQDFEMTTHGHIGPGNLESVLRALHDCYVDPRAYTISDLYQAIRDFRKQQG